MYPRFSECAHCNMLIFSFFYFLVWFSGHNFGSACTCIKFWSMLSVLCFLVDTINDGICNSYIYNSVLYVDLHYSCKF